MKTFKTGDIVFYKRHTILPNIMGWFDLCLLINKKYNETDIKNNKIKPFGIILNSDDHTCSSYIINAIKFFEYYEIENVKNTVHRRSNKKRKT